MSRYRLALLACLTGAYLSSNSVSFGGVLSLDQVKAIDSSSNIIAWATAAHGFLEGNDVSGPDYDPLNTLLNDGSGELDPQLFIDGEWRSITISDTGMFSTDTKPSDPFDPGEVVDLVLGAPVTPAPGSEWTFLDKMDVVEDDSVSSDYFTFTSDGEDKSGRLAINDPYSPLGGNLVVSLKAGNQYSVYAFSDISGVDGFDFIDLPFGLSHVSLFSSPVGPSGQDPPGVVPEPASVLVWTLGLIGCGTVARRRRMAVTG